MNEQPVERADIHIRPLAADDWQQARAVRLAALADAPYAFASTLAKEEAYEDELWRRRAGSGRTFGAFDGPTIIGVATAIPVDELDSRTTPGSSLPGTTSSGPAGTDQQSEMPEWHLVGMWVAPDYRGQGVADRLVEAVCERARAAGAAAVTLWVTEMNNRAISLYRRHGFVPNGARQLVWPEEPDHWEMELACPLR